MSTPHNMYVKYEYIPAYNTDTLFDLNKAAFDAETVCCTCPLRGSFSPSFLNKR